MIHWSIRAAGAARDLAREIGVGAARASAPSIRRSPIARCGGWKRSAFVDLNQHGPDGVRLWTKTKTVTAKWPEDVEGSAFVIPTMG